MPPDIYDIHKNDWTNRTKKRKTENDENKEINYKRGKHEYENVLKSFKLDIDSKEIYQPEQKDNLDNCFRKSVGRTSLAVGSILTVTGVSLSVGIPNPAHSSFIPVVARLIANELCSKLKPIYTKLRD